MCLCITGRVPQTGTTLCLCITGRVSQTGDNWLCVDYRENGSNWRQLGLCELPVECLKLETTGSVWIIGRVPQTGDN